MDTAVITVGNFSATERPTRKGKALAYTVEATNGDRYGFWEFTDGADAMRSVLQVGATAEVEYELRHKDDKTYKNLVGAKPASREQAESAKADAPKSAWTGSGDRSVAFKAAVRILTSEYASSFYDEVSVPAINELTDQLEQVHAGTFAAGELMVAGTSDYEAPAGFFGENAPSSDDDIPF